MSGIYIHVPFCYQRCFYCDFYSTLRVNDKESFVERLIEEIAERQHFLNDKNVDTIYFGGGTPSLLDAASIKLIIDKIKSRFIVSDNPEITLEANPDDLNDEYLKALSLTDVNRLSIGIQSFNNADLKRLNRRHNSEEAVQSVLRANSHGFKRISIDLMFALPDQELIAWENNIKRAVELPVDHISAYNLTYEKGTKFYKWLKEGVLKETDDSMSHEMFERGVKILEGKGFEHYEISNFAKEGNYSRHNTKYWFGEEYLGLGPSAHSFNGNKREWNISDIDTWLKGSNGNIIRKSEQIDLQTRRNEMIMTRLRTKWGIPEDQFTELFGEKKWNELLLLSSNFIDNKLMTLENKHLSITPKGKFLSDGIISELFII